MTSPADPSHPDFARRAPGVLVSSQQSGGGFALMEYDIPPHTLVAPLHTHRREDEYSYVVTGTLGAQIGERTLLAGAHELIAKHRGVPHTLWNPSDSRTRVLELIAPGGFERCLQELYRPGKRTPAELQRLWSEYEIEMDAGSIPTLLRRHGLSGPATG